jgi:hypothetical protein
MTLNIIGTSRTAVYLSGDFRLTTYDLTTKKVLRRDDNLLTQKLVPVVRPGWSAVIAWTGVAKTPSGEDVGDWLVKTLDGITLNAAFDELPKKLLTANSWLGKLAYRDLAFSGVGFCGRKPVAFVISNFLGLAEKTYWPRKPKLEVAMRRPKQPEVFFAGDLTGVTAAMRSRLKSLLGTKRPAEMLDAMAAVNVEAAKGSADQTISDACLTASHSPTGQGGATIHGIPKGQEYVPGFVRRIFLKTGMIGFNLKVGQDGKREPPALVQLGWAGRVLPGVGPVTGIACEFSGVSAMVGKDQASPVDWTF